MLIVSIRFILRLTGTREVSLGAGSAHGVALTIKLGMPLLQARSLNSLLQARTCFKQELSTKFLLQARSLTQTGGCCKHIAPRDSTLSPPPATPLVPGQNNKHRAACNFGQTRKGAYQFTLGRTQVKVIGKLIKSHLTPVHTYLLIVLSFRSTSAWKISGQEYPHPCDAIWGGDSTGYMDMI